MGCVTPQHTQILLCLQHPMLKLCTCCCPESSPATGLSAQGDREQQPMHLGLRGLDQLAVQHRARWLCRVFVTSGGGKVKHQAPIPRVLGIVSLRAPLAAQAVVGSEPQGAPRWVVGAERWLVPKGRGNGSGGMPGAAAMSWEGDGIESVFPSLDSAPLTLPPLKVIPLGPELGHPKVEHQCLQSKEWAIMQSLATVAKPGTCCCDQWLWAVPWAERPLLAGCGGYSAPCGVGGTLGGCAMQPGRSWLCTWGCQETVSGMFPVCELVAVFVACDLCHAEFGWKLGFG